MKSVVGMVDVSIYLPPDKLISDLLVPGKLNERKLAQIGVKSVPVAQKALASDLAINAARSLLEKNKINPKEIDILVYAGSLTPDFLAWLPSARVCHELNLNNAFGFDLNIGCGSFQLAIKLVSETLCNNKWSTALLVSGDKFDYLTNNQETNEVIMGDAGAAMLLKKNHDKNVFFGFDAITKGYYHDMTLYTGFTPAANKFIEDNPSIQKDLWTFANKGKLENFLDENIDNYIRMSEKVLFDNGMNIKDISYVVVPTGRLDIMNKIVQKLNFPKEKTNIPFIENLGDCAASGFAIDIKNIIEHFQPNPGEYTLCLGAGLGISWMGSILRH
ncbi:3-oxoacyl-[acyl-carrier-protein] synthase III C-terminal domain-containing protein [Bacillus anthracis]|uniref:3-oxoacyl-ACP synthase III family protein n=1 Tax=Bacillus anthracis TaxID=1392 RepID=UPI003D1BD478